MRKVLLPGPEAEFTLESPILHTPGLFGAWVDCIAAVFAGLRGRLIDWPQTDRERQVA
ncbi:MAG: hypothetical protein ABSE55_14645 [Terracidiphilus sp.]